LEADEFLHPTGSPTRIRLSRVSRISRTWRSAYALHIGE
jgi:hypothetical protein